MIDFKKLRAMRAYHGLTQKAVEIESKMGKGTYNQKERGEVSFMVDDILGIGKLYKLTPREFDEVFFGGAMEWEN